MPNGQIIRSGSKSMEARERVRTKALVDKAKKNAKKRKRKPNRMRVAQKRWYELEAYFDPHEIEAIPVKDGGFMKGILEDFVVVEVPKGKSPEELDRLGAYLASMELKVLIVQEGINFLRLKEVSGKQEKELDEILKQQTLQDQIDREQREKAGKENASSETTKEDGPTETGNADV